ncbi:MAG TPA: hypothetical protein VFT22_18875, partial [Kofleriaceae bacterium]|nr:hypothetical protein [Kofleriaceae bacterium]
FDERADFYTFDMGVLAAVITASDPRILSCTSVTLLNPDGTTIPNPPAPGPTVTPPLRAAINQGFGQHYEVVANGVNLTINVPSA